MSLSPDKLADRLIIEGVKTVKFFRELPEDAWEIMLYTEGENWRVRQVFIHLVQAENAILRLMQSILDGSEGTPSDFDLDAYNERKVHEMESAGLELILQQFENVRSRTVAWTKSRAQADLSVTGRHPFLGVAPIEEMVKLLYRHTQLHQRDVRRCLNGVD